MYLRYKCTVYEYEFRVNIKYRRETADVGDLVRTIIVDSTVISRIKERYRIMNINKEALFILCSYEKEYNSILSNGTSARHDIFQK